MIASLWRWPEFSRIRPLFLLLPMSALLSMLIISALLLAVVGLVAKVTLGE